MSKCRRNEKSERYVGGKYDGDKDLDGMNIRKSLEIGHEKLLFTLCAKYHYSLRYPNVEMSLPFGLIPISEDKIPRENFRRIERQSSLISLVTKSQSTLKVPYSPKHSHNHSRLAGISPSTQKHISHPTPFNHFP